MKKTEIESAEEMSVGDHELWVLLEQTHFAIARARDLELNHYGLTPAQASVLYTLEKNNGKATQDVIAQYTMRQHHSVSTLINRMTSLGLVKKVKGSKEKKSSVVITEKARKLYSETERSSIKMILSVLTEAEREIFANYLKLLQDKARNLLGLDYKPPFLP